MIISFGNFYLKYLTPCIPLLTVYQGSYKSYSRIMSHLNPNEIVFMHKEGSTNLRVVLRYIDSALNIDRQFNYNRHTDEPIKNFLSRLCTSINTYVSRDMKKKKKRYLKEKIKYNDIEVENIKFMRNNCVLDGDLTCKTILEHSSEIKLFIYDKEYIVKQNIPFVLEMELSSSILLHFPTYPSKFKTIHVDTAMTTFNWYRYESYKWIHIGEGYLYVPNTSDLGCRLKLSCEPRNKTETGPVTEVISEHVVKPGPGLCPFDTRHDFTTSKLSGKSFRITSYNILASVYSITSLSKYTLYPYCPEYALSMDYRKLLILKELTGYNADIICLQEVESKIYNNDLMHSLHTLNYDSVFNLKGDNKEGVVTFYNQERFEKLNSDCSTISEGINLDEFNTTWSQIQNENLKQTFLQRNTIIQRVTLKSKENSEILVIGNTHLYFRPRANHIRLLQAYYGLMYLYSYAKKMKAENAECNVSIIYCGDFNSVPESAVYELMTKKHISDYHNDLQSDPDQHIQIPIKHDVNLRSACGTPKYTNYTNTFSACLDYIFYQTDHLEIEQVIPMPSEEELNVYTGLPSVVLPSDHISLCVDLKWSK